VSRRRALVTRPTRVAALVAALVTGIVATTPGVGAVGTAAAAGPPATGRPTSAGGAAHSDPRLLGAPSLPSRALYGWGGNDAGQVGNGALGGGSSDGVTLPVQDADPSGQSFATIAAGGAFTVGLTTSGRAYAWGAGSLGQLGDGTTAGSTAPMPVAFPTLPAGPGGAPDVVTAVAAGSAHALALTSTGQVYAWGADLFGQLGDGTNAATDVPTPIDAPPGVTFTAVSAGGDHSLALASNGQVYAWGANTYGQLGDGTTTDRTRPTPVATPAGLTFTGIAAGTGHSLAVDSDGGVYSWGFDGSGQLGLGSTTDSALPQPVTMPAGTAVASVAAGGSHSLALSTSGLVFAWGSDVFGQLSSALVGTLPVDSDVPVQPLGLPPATTFVQISAGQTTSYALTSNGVPWIWGGDFFGQLGDGGSGVNAAVPEAMTTLPPGTAATGLFSGPDSSTSFLVTRAQQSITFPSVTGATYGGPPVDVAPVLDSGLNPSNSAEGACTGALVRLVLIGAGPCTVTSTQDGSFAYYPAAASTTFAVAPATLTVVPDARTTDAGSPLPTFTYHLTGFVDGDTATVVTGAADCTSDASAGSFPGDYAIRCTPGTLHAANYTFVAGPPAGLAVVASSSGYAVFGADGSLWAKGSVETSHGTSDAFAGSMAGTPLAAPVVGAAYTPLHDGYWMVASDGGIFAFGSARFEGSMGGKPLNRPIVGLAPTPDGGGYWEVAADGGIFSFGDAAFFGSTGNLTLVQPITGMAATPDGRGYWLVARDGGVFAFGDARFHGSTGGRVSLDPVVGLAPTPDGGGYWMVTRHGAVFPFGDAAFEGSLRYEILGAPIAGMAPTGDGKGYWLVGADGGVFAFGDAPFQGAVTRPPAPIVGII
jgi:alpha-tubulin suppressor-like RCC1 family protein